MPTTLDAKLTIRKHWKSSAVFTDSLCPGQGQKVAEADLLPGELSTEIFRVGCYTVRSAQRIYQVCEPGYSPEQEIPASPEDMEIVRKEDPWLKSTVSTGIGFQSWQNRLRVTHEISARHQDNPSGSFTMICRAAESRDSTWSEHIGPVMTAKEYIVVPDNQASLFVCNTYVGDSFSADTWYKLAPDGATTTLSLHPYNSERDKTRFT